MQKAPKQRPFCGTRKSVEGTSTELRPCGTQYDHWASHADKDTGLVSIPSGSVWHRLKHDRPVPLSEDDERDLLTSFNEYEVKRRNASNGSGEDMIWEDLSDARRRYLL